MAKAGPMAPDVPPVLDENEVHEEEDVGEDGVKGDANGVEQPPALPPGIPVVEDDDEEEEIVEQPALSAQAENADEDRAHCTGVCDKEENKST